MKVIIQSKLKEKRIPLKETKVLLKETVKTALKVGNIKMPLLVSVLLVEDEEIRCINRDYRHIDSITDVLSFPMLKMKDGRFTEQPGEMDMEEGKLFLGDIAVAIPRAMEQAKKYGHSVERELAFLTVHGLLHLLGYDHHCPQSEALMKKRQEQVMSHLGLVRDFASTENRNEEQNFTR